MLENTPPAAAAVGISPVRKRCLLFVSFPYICPEPVLAKLSFYVEMAQRDRFRSPPLHGNTPVASPGAGRVQVQGTCDGFAFAPAGFGHSGDTYGSVGTELTILLYTSRD